MEMPSIDRRKHPEWLVIDAWHAPDGWPLRRFRVEVAPESKKRGSILFQTGRADFLEKYIESFDYWRRQGWSVEGFDWRGQGGSGRLLEDQRLGHGVPYEVMISDLAAFVEDWRARRAGPHVAIGHSMGGHIILRWLAEQGAPIDGAILLAPMLGLNTAPVAERIGRIVARSACRLGLSERPAWSDSATGNGHRQRNLTHSPDRYADEIWWREQDERLDVGPPTWGWLSASWQSIAKLRAPGVLQKITAPILVLYAERDRLVRANATRRLARLLPNTTLLSSRAAAHELLREDDPIRLWALSEIDEFIESVEHRE